MTTLHINLFGQLRLFWQERPYPFKALPKVEPLLVYLLLHQDAPVQRDSLAFKLRPDATEKQAKGRLRRFFDQGRNLLKLMLSAAAEAVRRVVHKRKGLQVYTDSFYPKAVPLLPISAAIWVIPSAYVPFDCL